MTKTTPVEFMRQVKRELAKVTFPTRRETMLSVMMVVIMVSISSVIFFLADSVIQLAIGKILGLGV